MLFNTQINNSAAPYLLCQI